MQKLLVIYIFLLTTFLSAETLKLSFGGKQKIKNVIEFPNNTGMMFNWTSENTFTSNTHLFGSSICSGSMQLGDLGQIQSQYIVCEATSQNGYKVWLLFDNPGGDIAAEVNPFKVIHGTGPWKEAIGAKCLGALRTVYNEDYYLFDASCNLTRASFDRINNFEYKK